MRSKVEIYIIEQVKRRRNERKWSQKYIADCINVSQSFIYKIESPKYDKAYNIDHLNELAKVFKCDLWDLIPKKPIYSVSFFILKSILLKTLILN